MIFEHLIDRPAHYQPCPHCGRHTLTAWSSGVHIRLDPEPLTINQEIAAILARKQTWDLLTYGLPPRLHPVWRDITRIRAGHPHPVVADHQCPPAAIQPQFTPPETEITIPYETAASETPLF